ATSIMAKRKKTEEGPKLKQYEAMFLLPAGASAELENTLTMLRGIIERHGGEVMVLKKWDERKLAYEIKRHKRGLYIIAYFRAPRAGNPPARPLQQPGKSDRTGGAAWPATTKFC